MSTTIINNCGCCGQQCTKNTCGICIPVTVGGILYDKIDMGYPCCNFQSSITHECTPDGDGPTWEYGNCPNGIPIPTPCTSHIVRYMSVTLPPMNLGSNPDIDCPTCSICSHPGGTYILADLFQNPSGISCDEFNEGWGSFGSFPGSNGTETCIFGYYGYIYITTGGNCGGGGGCGQCVIPANGGSLIGSFIRIVVYYQSNFDRWAANLDIGNIVGRNLSSFPIGCRTCSGRYACETGPLNNQNNFNCKGTNIFTGGAYEGQSNGCASLFGDGLDRCLQNNKYCGALPTTLSVEVL